MSEKLLDYDDVCSGVQEPRGEGSMKIMENQESVDGAREILDEIKK